MSKTFVSHNNIISNLGFTSDLVVTNVAAEISGLQLIDDEKLLPNPFYASMISSELLDLEFNKINSAEDFTKLEKMMILSLTETLKKSNIELNEKVGLLISTTKGNIDVLEEHSKFPKKRAYLSELGKIIKDFFGFKNEAIVISNACVSGILAIPAAKKFINEGLYNHVFVVAADLVTPFVLSGFTSFQALSSSPCKPYDLNRNGINIGEVAASVLVTSSEENLAKEAVSIVGDASANDANHISGPSRTGEGLFKSIKNAIHEAKITSAEIDYISAHGTATTFNDEMEAIALNRLQLQNTPINSLKGYFGHTLGASGLLETIIGMHSLNKNKLFASIGFSELGTSKPLNIIQKTEQKELNIFLKTSSGFGGCNTAVLFKKFFK